MIIESTIKPGLDCCTWRPRLINCMLQTIPIFGTLSQCFLNLLSNQAAVQSNHGS